MSPIFIIGFMGSGKTAVAVEIARQLGLQAIDIDEMVEKYAGRSINDIFEQDGEAAFRKMEKECLEMVLDIQNSVVSTGGGLPCHFDNMDRMLKKGTCVYLQSTADELFEWLQGHTEHRPLVKGKSGKELRDWIAAELAKRELFYLKAQIVAKASTSAEEISKLIR
jgi:shikimate kinase